MTLNFLLSIEGSLGLLLNLALWFYAMLIKLASYNGMAPVASRAGPPHASSSLSHNNANLVAEIKSRCVCLVYHA